jgi:hypothetical protein
MGVTQELGRANLSPCTIRLGLPFTKLLAFTEKSRSVNEFRSWKTQTKKDNTRYRGRIEKIERPREGLLVVLADHSTEGSILNREGGEPLSQGPTVGKVKQGITFLW